MTYQLKVQTSPGDGLLMRRRGALLFIPAPSEEADELVAAFNLAEPGRELDALADETIRRELQTVPYAAVQAGKAITLRVFGDIELRTDIVSVPLLSAGASSTWVEHRVHGSPEAALISAGSEPLDGRTDLDHGIVNAGGFGAVLALADGTSIVPESSDLLVIEDLASEPPVSETAGESELLDYVLGAFPKNQADETVPDNFGALVFDDGERHVLAGDVVLGRNPTKKAEATKATPLVVSGDRVSRAHLRLRVTGDQVWAEDCESRNGSVLVGSPNDEPFKLLANSPQEIADGAVLYLGSRSFTFSKQDVSAASEHLQSKRKDPMYG